MMDVSPTRLFSVFVKRRKEAFGGLSVQKNLGSWARRDRLRNCVTEMDSVSGRARVVECAMVRIHSILTALNGRYKHTSCKFTVKARSPSCGVEQTSIDGRQTGMGVFALLGAAGIPVLSTKSGRFGGSSQIRNPKAPSK